MGKRASGEGTLFQRKDGRWVAELPVTDASGRRRNVTRYAKTQKAALAALRQLEQDQERGVQLGTKAETLSTYLERWLVGSVEPSVRVKTAQNYRSICEGRIIPRIGGLKLDKITPAVVASL